MLDKSIIFFSGVLQGVSYDSGTGAQQSKTPERFVRLIFPSENQVKTDNHLEHGENGFSTPRLPSRPILSIFHFHVELIKKQKLEGTLRVQTSITKIIATLQAEQVSSLALLLFTSSFSYVCFCKLIIIISLKLYQEKIDLIYYSSEKKGILN